MRQFAATEWARARRSLASARALVEDDPDSAASRAYYAVFHAATAVFALQGKTFSKHSSIRAALHKELVLVGLLSQQNGRDFDFLLDLRETGDYGGLAKVSSNDARLAVGKAEALLDALAALETQQEQ